MYSRAAAGKGQNESGTDPSMYNPLMFELTTENTTGWLHRHGHVSAGEAVQVRELADGVSGVVLRVETPKRRFVIKQSRPQLRTQAPWFSDLGRIWRERDVMQLLRLMLPAGAVPAVLFSVDEDFAFAMSHAPEPFRNWRSMLLGGDVDPALGEQAGRLLGAIHEATARPPSAMSAFADRTVFEQLRVEPFYLKIQQRHPDLADAVQPLIERMRTLRLGLCHGDFSPKNLLVHAGNFTLVDYETGHWGDTAMDLGFFLSHLLLKAVHRPQQREEYFELTRRFWLGYETSRLEPAAQARELQSAALSHMAVCLLARVDGTSPAPYLTDDAKRESVRRIARTLLAQSPADWKAVLRIVRE